MCRVERMYYESMIASNRSYASKFTEAELGLVPLEEFHRSADTSSQASISQADSEHELQRQRLLAEGRAREQLLSTLKQVKQAQKEYLVCTPRVL
jgi:hypothetical protein